MLFETPRLIVRDHAMTNLDLMLAWENDPELLYYNDDQPEPYEPTTREEMERYLQRLVKNDGSRGILYFAIYTRCDNRLIGYGMIAFINPYHRRCKVGITIGEKTEWGKGYGTEALQGAVDYCFRQLHMHRVGAEVYAINPRSIRMLERVGFKREGTVRQSVLKDGRLVDEHIYGILRSEWEQGMDMETDHLSTSSTAR